MSLDELTAKFRQLSSSVFEGKWIDELLEIIQGLDRITDLKSFFEILRKSPA